MASSLALPAPDALRSHRDGSAGYALISGLFGAQGTGRLRPPVPAILPSGARVLFTGWFDNRTAVAARLGLPDSDPATVYGHAVERWGDEAERHVIGSYAAVINRPERGEVRLARSPFSAPPLHFHQSPRMAAAASVPRALFALGLPAELDEERLAAHLHAAVIDRPGGWYKGIGALRLGTVATLTPAGVRLVQAYDSAAIPAVRLARDEDYVAQAEALLDEAIDATLPGFRQPATLLTGGLDSTLVASHLLDRLPTDQRLPSFTWTSEAGHGGRDSPFHFADERARVEAFAAMHPRIEPHFLDNAGTGFDDGMQDLFLLAGVAPSAIGLIYPYHGALAAARQRGCDLVIGAGGGNTTFSAEGRSAYTEFLLTGRWRQLWRALAARPGDDRPVWRRLVSLSLLRVLPEPLWRAASRWRGALPEAPHRTYGALNPAWPGRAALEREAAAADPGLSRPFYRSRAEEVRAVAAQTDADGFDLMQGLQQKYRIAFRDVTLYRPLVEFCRGLPVDQLMRDGESRYLARRMGRERLPDAIRTETRYGLQHGDWHWRIGQRRDSLRQELERLRGDAEVCRMVDVDRLIGLLDGFPDSPGDDPELAHQYQIALPSGIAAARLIRYVRGTNG